MSAIDSTNHGETIHSNKHIESNKPNELPNDVIKVPSFRKITDDESPYNFDDIFPGATDNAAAQILESHTILELIEDRIDRGNEKRVKHPSSLIKIYNMHETYDFDNEETAKLSKCTSKPSITMIARNWPKRVYDDENIKMSDKLQKEFTTRYNEYIASREEQGKKSGVKKKRKRKSSTSTIQNKAHDKYEKNEFRTESDNDTIDDDFQLDFK